jgi:hypothetical protein
MVIASMIVEKQVNIGQRSSDPPQIHRVHTTIGACEAIFFHDDRFIDWFLNSDVIFDPLDAPGLDSTSDTPTSRIAKIRESETRTLYTTKTDMLQNVRVEGSVINRTYSEVGGKVNSLTTSAKIVKRKSWYVFLLVETYW